MIIFDIYKPICIYINLKLMPIFNKNYRKKMYLKLKNKKMFSDTPNESKE